MGFHILIGNKSRRQRLEREVETWLDGVLISSEPRTRSWPDDDFPSTRSHVFVDYDGKATISLRVGGPSLGGALSLQLHRAADYDGRKKDSREVAAIVAAIVYPEA